MAVQFGYRASIEKSIAGGGSVDVLLERDEKFTAVEINIITGSEHDLHNLENCLAAGFESVIVIGNNARRLTPSAQGRRSTLLGSEVQAHRLSLSADLHCEPRSRGLKASHVDQEEDLRL